MHSYEMFKDELITGYQSEYSGKKSDKYIQKIRCLFCGKNKAFSYMNNPFIVNCNRKNKCPEGQNVSYREYFPRYQQPITKLFPPTADDKFSPVNAYMAIERGLKDYKRHGLKPTSYHDSSLGKDFFAVEATLSDGKTKDLKLIEHPERKSHIIGSAPDQLLWLSKKIDYDYSRPIYLCEATFKAMALIDGMDFQSMAVISASYNPFKNKFVIDHLDDFTRSGIIISLDNDAAGRKCAKKWMNFCQNNKIQCWVMLPPDGKDWDDLLKEGRLNSQMINESKQRGQLFFYEVTGDFSNYYETLRENEKKYPAVVLFRGTYWRPDFKEKGSDDSDKILSHGVEISRFHLKAAFSRLDDSEEFNHQIENVLYIKTVNKTGDHLREKLVQFDSKQLTSLEKFKDKIMSSDNKIFNGNAKDLSYIIENLVGLDQIKKVRLFNYIGHDSKTDSYIFPKFLYDKNGKRHSLNDHGFFTENLVKPSNPGGTCFIQDYEELRKGEVKEILETIYAAWGIKGLLATCHYLLIPFSHIIFQKYEFYPFLVIYGPPNTGKTTHGKINGQMLFMDEEGLPLTKKNTNAGIGRIYSQRSSLPLPLLEGNKIDNLSFDEDEHLALYNRGPMSQKGKKNLDNDTKSWPFQAGLILIRNKFNFSSAAFIQRCIPYHYFSKSVEERTKTSVFANRLASTDSKKYAGVGHFILSKRKEIECQLINQFEYCSDILKERGILDQRRRRNQAVPLSSLTIISLLLGLEKKYQDEAVDMILNDSDKVTEESMNIQNPIASSFFEMFDDCITYNKIIENVQYKIGEYDGQKVYFVRLESCIKKMGENNYRVSSSDKYRSGIEQSKRFIKMNHEVRGKKDSPWLEEDGTGVKSMIDTIGNYRKFKTYVFFME